VALDGADLGGVLSIDAITTPAPEGSRPRGPWSVRVAFIASCSSSPRDSLPGSPGGWPAPHLLRYVPWK
jgi:hypothetical protein